MASGKITAKANGSTTITVYSLATKSTTKSNKNNKTYTINVHVGPFIDSVSQIESNQFAVTFKSPITNVKPSDFTITNDATKVTYPVKAVTDETKGVTNYLISTFAEIKAGGTYTVTYDKTAGQLTATDGTVASISIYPATVPIKKASEIIGLLETGDVIITGTANTDVAPASFLYTISDTQKPYNSLSSNIETSMIVGKTPYYAVFGFQDTKGNTITDYSNYTVSSSNPEIFMVNSSSIDNATASVAITPVKEGTAYINIKNTAQTIIATLPVIVLAKSEPKNLSLEKNNASPSKGSDLVGYDIPANSVRISYTIKDQYGKPMNTANVPIITCTSAPSTVSKDNINNYKINSEEQTLVFSNCINSSEYLPTGTYTYSITCDGLTQTFQLIIKEPSVTATSSYSLSIDYNTIDNVVNGKSDLNKTLHICLNKLNDNTIVSSNPIYPMGNLNLSITNSKGESIDALYRLEDGIAITQTIADVIYQLPADTYTIQYDFDNNGTKLIILSSTESRNRPNQLCSIYFAASPDEAKNSGICNLKQDGDSLFAYNVDFSYRSNAADSSNAHALAMQSGSLKLVSSSVTYYNNNDIGKAILDLEPDSTSASNIRSIELYDTSLTSQSCTNCIYGDISKEKVAAFILTACDMNINSGNIFSTASDSINLKTLVKTSVFDSCVYFDNTSSNPKYVNSTESLPLLGEIGSKLIINAHTDYCSPAVNEICLPYGHLTICPDCNCYIGFTTHYWTDISPSQKATCAATGNALDKLKLGTPKIKITVKKKKAVIKFAAVKNATKYQIYYKKAGAKKWSKKTIKSTKYTVKSLNSKKKYSFKVRAVITDSNGTAYSSFSKIVAKKIK